MRSGQHFNWMFQCISVILFIIIVVTTCGAQELLVPKYDAVSRQEVYFNKNGADIPLVLNCKPSVSGFTLGWAKDGINVTDISDLHGRYTMDEDKLKIRDPKNADSGNYTCSIKELNLEAIIHVIGRPEVAEFLRNIT